MDTDVEWVSELIDPISFKRQSESIFVAPDVDAILQIPLRRSVGEDLMAWQHERSGI